MSPRLSFSRDVLFETLPALKEDTTPGESKNEDQSAEFEFSMAMKGCDMAISCSSMLSPDELFRNGEIVPLLAQPDLLLRQHPSSEENQSIKPLACHDAENSQITLAKTSQASMCCAAESSASPVSASKGWKDIFQKKSLRQDYVVAECFDRHGRARKSLYHYSRSISAGEAKALDASAQPMLERSKSDSRASWCGSTAVIPAAVAAVSASPAGAITKGTEELDRLVRKFSASGVDVSPVAEANPKSLSRGSLPEASNKSVLFDKTSSEGTSRFKGSDYPPPPYPIKKIVDYSPGSTGSRKPCFPRLDRELVRNGNRDDLRKAAVANVDRIYKDLRRSCVAELNQNGKIRSQARPLRHYENRRNSEKVCVYQRNMQVTQVLHMNGCMGKSLLAPKVRLSECSSSDFSKKVIPNCKTTR
ncbi:hypothetical protein O6H91_07G050200 [Diphasiastrum complanatum]|nr:hypothetical protein O6H91_Y457300 [Diphasiastrum complanatum]KAJ7549363.1 hypothetical protein O6H91_07G050200 [Diphasiastrum complanatum]